MTARLAFAAAVLAIALAAPALHASPGSGAVIAIGIIAGIDRPAQPVSPLDIAAEDEALQGARLGAADNATTGHFTGQTFRLLEERPADLAAVAPAVHRLEEAGVGFIVSDLRRDGLTAVLAARSPVTVVLNARSQDDRLRNEDCQALLLHVAPSRAMQADALAQYLVVRRWPRWFLVVGRHEEDALAADAVRQAAKRFGGRIVEEKKWAFEPGNPHADSGHVTLQAEIPPFTRAADHDVLIVADERGEFGDSLPYRTWAPRPVAGTQGLVATAWSPVQEQWGALQLQSRFERQAHRRMSFRDYTAWLAVRAVGEAAIRSHSADPATIAGFMTGPEFRLGGFKGQPFSFRSWDGQLRQPMLIAGPRMLVSVSPQPEFLHEGSPLDSLGPDATETRCKRR
jgi:ABC transporter substrate binding protein (PQQ-dependent alcohol dehydrogenase system)